VTIPIWLVLILMFLSFGVGLLITLAVILHNLCKHPIPN
jgi:hypothetical protein